MDKGLLAVKATVPLTLLVGGLVIVQLGADNDGLRQALRATARLSLLLFAFAYVASPLHRLYPSQFSRWLMLNRTVIGVSFGLSISVHIGLILWLFGDQDWAVPQGVGPADFLIGMPGLAFVIAMMITSARSIRRAMSPGIWRMLHRVGLHLVWFI